MVTGRKPVSLTIKNCSKLGNWSLLLFTCWLLHFLYYSKWDRMAESVRFDIILNDLGSGPLKRFSSNAAKHISKVQKSTGQFQNNIGGATKKVEQLSRTFNKLSGSGGMKLNKELKTANGQMDRVLNKAGKLHALMNKGGNAVGGKVGARGFGFGMGAFAGFLGPMAAISGMRSMISTGAELQSQLVDIRAILATGDGFSGEAFERMTGKMKQLGADTIFTSREMFQGAKYMAMAGMSIEQIEQSMPAAANIAAIANIGIERAADIATNIQTAYGIAAKNMGNVTDVMARTMTSSNVSMEEMGESFKYVANEAARAGLDFKEVSAAIGVLGNNGIKASMAGTNLRQMLIRMKAPTTAAQKVLDKYNLSFTETVGGITKIKDLSKVIKEVNSRNLAPSELKDLFGVYGGSAFGALSTSMDEQGNLMLDKVTSQNAQAKGIASKMAAEKMKTFRGTLAKLQAQFELFANNIFVRVEPVLTKVMNVLESMFKNINTEGSWAMNALTAGINIVGNTLAWAYKFIKQNGEALKWAAGAAIGLFAAYKTFTYISYITQLVKGATVAWNVFKLALINNPIGWIATAIIGVGAAVVWAYNNFETFRAVIGTTWDLLKDFASSIGSLFDNPMESIKNAFKGISDFIGRQVQPLMELVESIKNMEFGKALKAGKQLLWNMSPAGIMANVTTEIVDKVKGSGIGEHVSKTFAKNKEWAAKDDSRIDFSWLTGGFKMPSIEEMGPFDPTGDLSSSIPVRMGGGGTSGDEEDGVLVKSYRGQGGQGGNSLEIKIESLLNINTNKLLDSMGSDGAKLKDQLTKLLMETVKDVEIAYGS
jgi:TP901 family phage tail tape measure protein